MNHCTWCGAHTNNQLFCDECCDKKNEQYKYENEQSELRRRIKAGEMKNTYYVEVTEYDQEKGTKNQYTQGIREKDWKIIKKIIEKKDKQHGRIKHQKIN